MSTLLIILLVCLPASAMAATLTWDRNSDTDMKDYQVWACFTPSCVVIKAPAMLQPGVIAQPAVGVNPTATLNTTGKEGSVAVSARDLSMNESGLSVPLPFDLVAPLTPANLILQ